GRDHVADAVADVEGGGGVGAEPAEREEDALGVGLGRGDVVVEDDDVEGAELRARGGDLPGAAALAGDDADGRAALAQRREQLRDAGIDALEQLVVQRLVVAVEVGEAGGDGVVAGDRLEQPDLGARLVGEQLVVGERAADVRRERAAVALEVEAPRADERAVEVEEVGHRSVAGRVDRALCRRVPASGSFAARAFRTYRFPMTGARAGARSMRSSSGISVAVTRGEYGLGRGLGKGSCHRLRLARFCPGTRRRPWSLERWSVLSRRVHP